MTLTISQRLSEPRPAQAQLILPFELRQKSRLLTQLSTGEEVGVVLERGTMLRGGDCLLTDDGRIVEVVAAPEEVSVVTAKDAWGLARAAYHLGNRHVSLQVGPSWLRYLHDHVLDDMVRGLGFTVTIAQLPFEPEGGAYSHSHTAGDAGHAHAFILNPNHPHLHG